MSGCDASLPLPPSLPLWANISVRPPAKSPTTHMNAVPFAPVPSPHARPALFRQHTHPSSHHQSDLDTAKFRLQAHIHSLGLSCIVRVRSSCPKRVLFICKCSVPALFLPHDPRRPRLSRRSPPLARYCRTAAAPSSSTFASWRMKTAAAAGIHLAHPPHTLSPRNLLPCLQQQGICASVQLIYSRHVLPGQGRRNNTSTSGV